MQAIKNVYKNTKLMDVGFLLFWKCLSKECCLNNVIFPVTAVKILHYIQHAFSFRVQPVKTMTVTNIELLSSLFCHVTLLICFERFDWSFAIGLLSLQTWPVSFEPKDETFNTSNVIFYVQENSPTFDTNSWH